MKNNETYTANRKRILALTGISEERLFWQIVDAGIAYLAVQCRGYKADIDEIKEQGFYWSWWVEQWHIRDMVLLAQLDDGLRERPTYSSYLRYHESECNTPALNDSYFYIVSPSFGYPARVEAKKELAS